ncbi:glycosyltransferase family 2 protein [Phascolarctobacterium faecium]|nr:glycosyltransferase family 2 protein [Phascolarctobacterium faecium]MDM8109657.1 glycosyltransferase family 2 protein [Phascolarctobacterium faecium]
MLNRTFIKVSIIVAIYNVEKFIKKCVESIINQDYHNIEIILIDDCSTDNSGKICDTFARVDNRIIVIHNSVNMKQSTVRNLGISKATGEYIVFVDGDDWLAKDFVSYMLKVINETNADMAINLVNFTTRDYKQVKNTKIEIWSAEKATAELLFPHITVGCWNKIYKRDFINKFNLRFNSKFYVGEGDKFINEAAQRANHVGIGCRKVYYYRLNNEESATTKYDVKQSEGALNVMKCIEKDLIIRTPYVLGALKVHIWLNHFWNIRQILATNTVEKNNRVFNESLCYIKTNMFVVAKIEPSISKKIKYILTGFFPILSAKYRNFLFNFNLKCDTKSIK